MNRKKLQRIMKIQRLDFTQTTLRTASMSQRSLLYRCGAEPALGHRPRMLYCGEDGWCVFVPVIDCCTREIFGYALERTGRAKSTERALEEALLQRFGTLRNAPQGMLLRHDNGLVFGLRQYRAVVHDYGLKQEYITPYTPQENGLCERFIKTFKEEFAWVRNYRSIKHARFALRAWIDHTKLFAIKHQINTTNTNVNQQPK